MISSLIPYAKSLKTKTPGLYGFLVRMGKKFLGKTLGVYPRPLSHEIAAVKEVLHGSQWNMVYGEGLAHEKLEAEFAEYLGVRNAIAVNTGGMALQMSMRALGLKPGNEVILQADTCSATAFAVMNAGATPIFADISERSFMLDRTDVEKNLRVETKVIIATHMWGNTEDISSLQNIAKSKNIFVIEDTCLSLGAKTSNGKMAGSNGHVGVFSFGCLKPIQAGEGGMIVTNDDALARELRSLRHWGDRSIDFGTRDATQLAWNGRMSEIVAAVAKEQLRGYPRYLSDLRDSVADFQEFLKNIDGIDLVLGEAESPEEAAFTQIVLKLDPSKMKITKQAFRDQLLERGVANWHANFELIQSLSFFQKDTWKDWILHGNLDTINANYHGKFPNSERVYRSIGLGLNKSNFHSKGQLNHLKRQIEALVVRS